MTDRDIDIQSYRFTQKLKWFLGGLNTHCISWDLFDGLTPERICELYNVEMSYFELKNGWFVDKIV